MAMGGPAASTIQVKPAGVGRASQTRRSSWHATVLAASVAVTAKLALGLLVTAGGVAVRVVSGAVVSIVQVKTAGVGSTFPAGSIARAWKLRLPAASPL